MGSPRAPDQVFGMRGHTLVELLFVLLLLAVGTGAFVPAARKLRDRAVASAGRETLVAGFAEARTTALRVGGSSLTIRRISPAYRVDTANGTGSWVGLNEPHARIRIDAGRDSISVAFDRMGLGRFASHSISVSVGEVERHLIVSSYGRVRRR